MVRSRSGHVIRLDDTEGAEKIEIVDKTGKNSITIDSASNKVTVTSAGDLEVKATGELALNEEKEPKLGKMARDVCPAAPGGKDWQPSAFSPRTGLMYVPHQNLCMDEGGVSANYIAGTPYVGMNVKMYPGPGGNRGDGDAFWRGAPVGLRERIDWLQQRINRGASDGSLDRREARIRAARQSILPCMRACLRPRAASRMRRGPASGASPGRCTFSVPYLRSPI